MGSAEMAARLNECMDGVLLRFRPAALRVLLLAADERFVALKRLALAAEAAGTHLRELHGFANTHAQEPSGAVAAEVQLTLHLLGGDPLLAGGHLVERQRPLGKGDVAALHYRLGSDGEGKQAIVALE